MVNHGNAVRKKARRKARKKARRKARRKAIRTIKYEDLTIDHDQCKKPFNKGTDEKVWIDSFGKTHHPDDTILDVTLDHDQCKKPSNKGTYKKVWIEFWEKTRSPDDTILWEDDNGNTHYR